ncbi:hypothetical protein BH10ACT8_BH10ACT8_07950 [soil metagenome]
MADTDPAAFFEAIAAGDVSKVRSLLDDDAGLLHEPGPQGASAALAALYAGHGPLADELAARTGELTVFEAAAFDDTDRLERLILADLEVVDQFSDDGWQPLHLAARFGRAEAARVLLDADAVPDEPSRNAEASRPLHAAAAGGHDELVWILIASDAEVDARRADGRTALLLATAGGHLNSVTALLAAGADSDPADPAGSADPADPADPAGSAGSADGGAEQVADSERDRGGDAAEQ